MWCVRYLSPIVCIAARSARHSNTVIRWALCAGTLDATPVALFASIPIVRGAVNAISACDDVDFTALATLPIRGTLAIGVLRKKAWDLAIAKLSV